MLAAGTRFPERHTGVDNQHRTNVGEGEIYPMQTANVSREIPAVPATVEKLITLTVGPREAFVLQEALRQLDSGDSAIEKNRFTPQQVDEFTTRAQNLNGTLFKARTEAGMLRRDVGNNGVLSDVEGEGGG